MDIAERYASLGYSGVDISFMDAGSANPIASIREGHWADWALETKEALQKIGITPVQSHAPIFNAFSPDIVALDEKKELMRRAVAVSGNCD